MKWCEFASHSWHETMVEVDHAEEALEGASVLRDGVLSDSRHPSWKWFDA